MLEEIIPLRPVDFFAFRIDCYDAKGKLTKKHELPDLSSFHGESNFADLQLGWNEEGIMMRVEIDGSFDKPDFPDYRQGDSIELFFDTRDIKTAGYPTRFCHHFFFLPASFDLDGETVQAQEVTRFRKEDAHPLCDPSLLSIKTEQTRKTCHVEIFIPAECLHGYDPKEFDRLGFAYRINRATGECQSFAPSEDNFPVEQQPALWSTLKLIKD